MFWETSVLEQQGSVKKEGNEEPSNEVLEETEQDMRGDERRRKKGRETKAEKESNSLETGFYLNMFHCWLSARKSVSIALE